MKKRIVASTVLVIGSVSIIKLGIINSLILFLLAGAIPGTTYSVPSSIMLLGTLTLIWLVVLYIAPLDIFQTSSSQSKTRSTTTHKKHLPSRRYNEI